jgi:hypothetical protein
LSRFARSLALKQVRATLACACGEPVERHEKSASKARQTHGGDSRIAQKPCISPTPDTVSNAPAIGAPSTANATDTRGQRNLGRVAQQGVAPPTRGTPAGPVLVLHRFEGQTKTSGIFGSGIGARRDGTHQVVQQRVADGKGGFQWRVTVQPVNEGRIEPDQHAFTASRPVTRKDFNDTNSRLNQSVRAAVSRLNDASNRLPEATPARPSSKVAMGKPSPAPQMSTVDWLGQQGKNIVGGATSMVTSTLGMVGSLPEKTGKLAGSVGDIGRMGINVASGGRLATTAFNPMSIDSHVRNYADVTNAERGMASVQRGIDAAIGANPDGFSYKASAVVTSFVGVKGKGGKLTARRAAVPDPAGRLPGTIAPRTTTPKTPVKLTRSGSTRAIEPIKTKATTTSQTAGQVMGATRAASTIRPVKMADGSARLMKGNGQPATLKEVIQAVADGRMTTRQLKQAKFSETAIKGVVRDAGKLRADSPAKPASASPKAGEGSTIPDDMLAQVQQTLNSTDFQQRLARSNSPAEVARQNQAIKQMRADGTLTASQIRPEGGGSSEPSARNEPQRQRQPKTENSASGETRYADDSPARPPLNLKPPRGEMNVKPGRPEPADPTTSTSGGNPASVAFGGVGTGGDAPESAARGANQKFAQNLFSNETRLADQYRQRALGDKPGQSPTTAFYGGHATSGLFAGIGGATRTEVMANVSARVTSLVESGQLTPLDDAGNGSFNRVYVQQSTGQIVRVGLVTSDELSGSNAMSKLQGQGKAAGTRIDLAQSLYAPSRLTRGGLQSKGLGVLVMERVPGQPVSHSLASLNATDRAKIVPQLADAIVAVHLSGRVHGDIAQRNVMFDPLTGQVRLLDFGNASRSKDTTLIAADLTNFALIIHRLSPAGQGSFEPPASLAALRQAKMSYFQAVDRLPGPDRSAPIYRQHAELYEKHVAQFEARRDALKAAVAVSRAASPSSLPTPRPGSRP